MINRPNPAPAAYTNSMRMLHWMTVLMLGAPYLAVYASEWVGAMNAERLAMVHRSAGLVILGVTLLRLVWRQRTTIPPLPRGMPRPQQAAARANVVALYGLLVLQPVLGLVGTLLSGEQATVFGSAVLPRWLPIQPRLSNFMFQVHGWTALLLLALIGLHVMAALFHHVVRRDGVMVGMLPGLAGKRR